jgi:anti-sigma factor RsiW
MNCRDIEEFAPLYLSGELEENQRGLFRAHLAECRNCATEMDRQIALDTNLRQSAEELPDATAIQRSIRGRIGRERAWRFAAVAAVALFAAALGSWALRPASPGRLYADAALDHRLEVVEHQPRHWRTDPAEIEKLAARFNLPDVAALAPQGYRLEHAKMCGIDGKAALHLVFTNGRQDFSVYIRTRNGGDKILREVNVGAEHLAAFQTDRLEAVVATAESSEECRQFAQFASRVL